MVIENGRIIISLACKSVPRRVDVRLIIHKLSMEFEYR